MYAPVENSPMTGFATARVPASTRREARAKAIGSNDPDYLRPRGAYLRPRALPRRPPTRTTCCTTTRGRRRLGRSPGRKEAAASSKTKTSLSSSARLPRSRRSTRPAADSQSGMGIREPTHRRPRGRRAQGGHVPAPPKGCPRCPPRARRIQRRRARGRRRARVARPRRHAEERGIAAGRARPSRGRCSKRASRLCSSTPASTSPAMVASLDTVEAVEEARGRALLTRTTSRAAAMRLVAGMHPQGGRLRAGDALTLDQFKLAMRRVNVMPASEAVTEAVFRKHDLDGNGSLDYQEFIRYLMPSDFEPVSPSVYRASYPGYTQPAPDPRRSAARRTAGRRGDPRRAGARDQRRRHARGAGSARRRHREGDRGRARSTAARRAATPSTSLFLVSGTQSGGGDAGQAARRERGDGVRRAIS